MNLNKLFVAFMLILASAPDSRAESARVRWLMGTFCEIDAWGAQDTPSAVTAAFNEIDRWDKILSLYKKESELNVLNASAGTGPFRASAELYAQTEAALRLARETGGAFDPTVLPVLKGGAAALPLVGWSKVRLDAQKHTIDLPLKGMGLDFGGIGKGWALDQAAAVLLRRGVKGAFLNFGGQILTVGRPDGGTLWTVVLPGFKDSLKTGEASVSTSGDTERPGHIVSPFDGRPVRRKVSATAVLATATDADAWSTALYVLGQAPTNYHGRSFFTASPFVPIKGESQ